MTLTSRRPAPAGQQFIVVAEGYWGKGATIEGALAQCVRQGGTRCKKKYLVYLIGDRTGVDSMGSFVTDRNDDGSYTSQVLLARVTGTDVVLDELLEPYRTPPLQADEDSIS